MNNHHMLALTSLILCFCLQMILSCGDDDDDDNDDGDEISGDCEDYCYRLSDCDLPGQMGLDSLEECMDYCHDRVSEALGLCVLETDSCYGVASCFQFTEGSSWCDILANLTDVCDDGTITDYQGHLLNCCHNIPENSVLKCYAQCAEKTNNCEELEWCVLENTCYDHDEYLLYQNCVDTYEVPAGGIDNGIDPGDCPMECELDGDDLIIDDECCEGEIECSFEYNNAGKISYMRCQCGDGYEYECNFEYESSGAASGTCNNGADSCDF